ncbi:MAG: DUF374 domain-containing protein [Planctomycetaceae bacterium]
MTPHEPVVTGFTVRPPTFPHGHWMNRFWGPLARGVAQIIARAPLYRYILRAPPGTRSFLKSGKAAIFACLHQDQADCFLALPRLFPSRRLVSLSSYSRDGGMAAYALTLMGYEVARGSSSHGGGEGLLMLRASLAAGQSAVLSCDGPRAPLGDVKPGVVRLAASARVPILPTRAWGLARVQLRRSWARSVFTFPFSPVLVCIGAPVEVPEEVRETRPYQIAVARSIAGMAAVAAAWAGGPPRAPFTPAEE